MRRWLAVFCLLLVAVAAASANRRTAECQLTVSLVASATGETMSGVIRVLDADKQQVPLPQLLSRGTGLDAGLPIASWSVLPKEMTLSVPRGKLTIEAFAGLETELAHEVVDLTDRAEHQLRVSLKTFYGAADHGYRSANTHLHLMKLSREEADRYLIEVPRADGLDLLFVSYLERADADRDYITNRYTRADLDELARKSGVAIGAGEEHRHNFAAQGEGYGHVMLLEISRLIQPVSIGPGIMKTGSDGLPIQRGIGEARRQGAAVIWCHNDWGLERLANCALGQLDAQNIFDGGDHGSYEQSYYRCLNAGLRLTFSTGTDWFMYDFSRAFVELEGPVTPKSWLRGLTSGKSYITNGPFLEFRVAGAKPGGTVKLAERGSVAVEARAVGRHDFRRLEIVQNGRVIRTQTSHAEGGHFLAELQFELEIDRPCWLALRTPPPPADASAETRGVSRNEYGRPLFAHTSAVDCTLAGRRVFDKAAAEMLLRQMEQNVKTIEKHAVFADAAEQARVLDVHADALAALQRHIERDGR